jgi:hypothetical protein
MPIRFYAGILKSGDTLMESDETLRQNEDSTNKILQAIGEMGERFEKVENDLHPMRQLQLSFDVRLDRLEAVVINVRADVKVLRAEVEA